MLSDRQIKEREVRKKNILGGALRVFHSSGIEKTTMDEIAAESGFGKATLYYYFTSKDEVFIAIMEDGWRQLWEGIESKIVLDVTPRKKFMGIIKKMASIVKGNKILYGFLFTAPNHIQDESKQSWKTYQERLYSILKSSTYSNTRIKSESVETKTLLYFLHEQMVQTFLAPIRLNTFLNYLQLYICTEENL